MSSATQPASPILLNLKNNMAHIIIIPCLLFCLKEKAFLYGMWKDGNILIFKWLFSR